MFSNYCSCVAFYNVKQLNLLDFSHLPQKMYLKSYNYCNYQVANLQLQFAKQIHGFEPHMV